MYFFSLLGSYFILSFLLFFLFRLWQQRCAVILGLVFFALFSMAYYTEGAHQQVSFFQILFIYFLVYFIFNYVKNQHSCFIANLFKGY